MLPFIYIWLNITLTFLIHRQLCYTWTTHIYANMKNIGKRVSFVNVLNAWLTKHVLSCIYTNMCLSCIKHIKIHVFLCVKHT